MKKYLFGLLAFVLAGMSIFGASFVKASGFTSGFGLNPGNVKEIGVAGAKEGQGENANGDPKLIEIIKRTINLVLGFLSLITLILLLWGGFQMVTANGDDNKFQAGQKILKQAGIGLGFIAISWFLVSMIFWLIAQAGASPNPPQGGAS